MPVDDAMFSSSSREWGTPDWLFDRYNAIYHYTIDVCATAQNTKVAKFFSESVDGLAQGWEGERCWMNPPYGHEIEAWVHKAWEERNKYTLISMLLPARTDTKWWHAFVGSLEGGRFEFLRSRVKFVLPNGEFAPSGAPFPSVVVTFRSGMTELQDIRWVDLRHMRGTGRQYHGE